jgi:hypothetical protein
VILTYALEPFLGVRSVSLTMMRIESAERRMAAGNDGPALLIGAQLSLCSRGRFGARPIVSRTGIGAV